MIRNPDRLAWIREMNKIPQKPPEILIGENVEIHPTVELGGTTTEIYELRKMYMLVPLPRLEDPLSKIPPQ